MRHLIYNFEACYSSKKNPGKSSAHSLQLSSTLRVDFFLKAKINKEGGRKWEACKNKRMQISGSQYIWDFILT